LGFGLVNIAYLYKQLHGQFLLLPANRNKPQRAAPSESQYTLMACHA
jgi:hypothetical protein